MTSPLPSTTALRPMARSDMPRDELRAEIIAARTRMVTAEARRDIAEAMIEMRHMRRLIDVWHERFQEDAP
jgi:hypothetical protein